MSTPDAKEHGPPQAAFLGEPGLAEPVTGVGFEMKRCYVVEH
jgi:hypothetical protein